MFSLPDTDSRLVEGVWRRESVVVRVDRFCMDIRSLGTPEASKFSNV